jgi:hypothetical protein
VAIDFTSYVADFEDPVGQEDGDADNYSVSYGSVNNGRTTRPAAQGAAGSRRYHRDDP